MKNNLIFLIVLIALLVTGLGALYYQYQSGQFELGRSDLAASPTPIQTASPSPNQDNTQEAGTNSVQPEQDVENMPTVSENDDLDTIQQELNETEILEETFNDL